MKAYLFDAELNQTEMQIPRVVEELYTPIMRRVTMADLNDPADLTADVPVARWRLFAVWEDSAIYLREP